MVAIAVEEELRWERRARALLQWASVAAVRSTDPRRTLGELLAEICLTTGWPIGHVLHRAADGALVSMGVWHLDDAERYQTFRQLSSEVRFPAGVGLPGRVLATRRPHWINDILADENFPRARTAHDLGVRSAFAFPVLIGGEVVAVLEFAAAGTHALDEPLLEVMESVGLQVGWMLERARTEKRLRDSELRFRSVAETAHDAIITADSRGHIVSWNRAAETLFGYQASEAVGEPLTLVIPERHRSGHDRGMERVRGGGPHHVIGRTVELEALRKDGSELPIELSLATWTAAQETFYTGILRDISDRRAADQRMRAITAELELSERSAVHASQAKSRFLASMSHELRTPLNAILGFVQLLERDAGLSPGQRESVEIIDRSGEHLLGLINNVLSLAKIEAGQTVLEVVAFDLLGLLRGVVEMVGGRARGRGLAVRLEASADLPAWVQGDEGKLRQVLVNLLGNAVKFTRRGQVVLRAAGGTTGTGVRFEVQDTGPGIAEQDLERIFQPFVQPAGRPAAPAQEGTGLGLAISRDFVRLMGGELEVQSEPGQGTTFAFALALPAAGERPPVVERRRVVGLAPGQPSWKILVVDNAADNRLLLTRFLERLGFQVREACDGAEAVIAWESWRPDLIWMDMRMPGVDGYTATRRIRTAEATLASSSARRRTAILALTASAFEQDRPAILGAGCDAILAKPFREDTLLGAMADHLGVQYELESALVRPAAPPADAALSPEALAAVAPDLRARLEQALGEGDDLAAVQVIAEIGRAMPGLAAALEREVGQYRFDELLELMERARR